MNLFANQRIGISDNNFQRVMLMDKVINFQFRSLGVDAMHLIKHGNYSARDCMGVKSHLARKSGYEAGK